MRTLIILLFTKNIAYVLSMAGLGAFKPCSAQHENSLGKGIYFEENKGQVLTPAGEERYDILFFGKSESMSFYVKSDGLSLQMYHREVSLREQLPDEPAAEELPPVHTLVERVDIE